MKIKVKSHGKMYEILIDDADWDLVKGYSLHINHRGKMLYGGMTIDGKREYLHRFLMGAKRGQIVDHINQIGLDCRRKNMRFVSKSGNQRNAFKKNNPHGYRGVSDHYIRAGVKSGKFRARINIDGKEKSIKNPLTGKCCFDTAKEASIEYEKLFAIEMQRATNPEQEIKYNVNGIFDIINI